MPIELLLSSSSRFDFSNSNYNYDNTNTIVSSHLCNTRGINPAISAKNHESQKEHWYSAWGKMILFKAKA